MNVDTSTLVSITEANQNFSRVARLVDEKGSAVILKNNKPRYLIINFDTINEEETASDEDVLDISRKLMKKIERPMRFSPNDPINQETNSTTSSDAYQGNRRIRRTS